MAHSHKYKIIYMPRNADGIAVDNPQQGETP